MTSCISTESNNPYQLPSLLLSYPSSSYTGGIASYNSIPVTKADITQGYLPAHPEAVEAPIPHSNNLKDRICQICYMAFKTPTNLLDHYPIHLEDRKQFACTECFFPPSNKIRDDFNKKDFDIHMLKHLEEKPHICIVCNKGFTRKKHLTAHKKIHTVDKPFKCSFCFKVFIRKGDLKTHIRTHTGEKPYKCEVCPETFNKSGALKRHIQIHRPKTNSAVNINLPMSYQNNNDNNGLDIDSLDCAKVAEIKESLEKELANFNSLETNSAVNINPPMDYQNNNNNNIYFMANNFLKIVKSLEEYHKVQTKNPEEELANINSVEANSAVNINLPMGYQNNNDNNEAISNKINGLDIDSLDHAKVAEIKESLEKELANFNSLETNSAVNINPQMDSQLKINYPYEDFLNFNLDYLPSDFDEDDTDENM